MQLNDLESALERVLENYQEPHTVRRGAIVAGETVPAVAELTCEQERTVFGIRMPANAKVQMGSTFARTFTLLFVQDVFDEACARRVISIIEAFEEPRRAVEQNHTFTFFDGIILTRSLQDAAATRIIRKFALRPNYTAGWGVVRIAVIDVVGRKMIFSKDAKELGKMTLARL